MSEQHDPALDERIEGHPSVISKKSSKNRAGCTSGVRSCGCSNCAMYRWYPPLLVVSTVLAGLFCTLYLTKPIRVVSPRDTDDPVESIPVSEPEQQDQEAERRYDQMVENSDSLLNPMLGGLPGESLSRVSPPQGNQALANSAIPPTGLEPLNVKGPRQQLFVPSAPEEGVGEQVAEVSPLAELPSAAVPQPEDGLHVEIPEAIRSEFVVAFTGNEESEVSNLMIEVETAVESDETFVELMRVALKGTQQTESAEVQAPASSIIGEFYVAEPTFEESEQKSSVQTNRKGMIE